MMVPVIRTPRAFLFNGEAAWLRNVLPEKSIDLVITDPPYSESVHRGLGRERRNDASKARDALIFAPFTTEDVRATARELVRLAKAWIIVFTDDRLGATWGQAFDEAGGRWVRTGHWVKSNPMPQMTGDRPGCGSEVILIAHAVGKKMSWNGGGRAAIWRGPSKESGIKRQHPNQKPVWLLRELVQLFSQPGELIVDPFAGSGSTGVAALAEGRSFVGVERDPKYVDIAKARLEAEIARGAA